MLRGSDLRRVTWLRSQTCYVAQISDVSRGSDLRRVTWLRYQTCHVALAPPQHSQWYNGSQWNSQTNQSVSHFPPRHYSQWYNGLQWSPLEHERVGASFNAPPRHYSQWYNSLQWSPLEHERVKASFIAPPRHYSQWSHWKTWTTESVIHCSPSTPIAVQWFTLENMNDWKRHSMLPLNTSHRFCVTATYATYACAQICCMAFAPLWNYTQVLRDIFGGMLSTECVQHLVTSPSLLATPSTTLQSSFQSLGKHIMLSVWIYLGGRVRTAPGHLPQPAGHPFHCWGTYQRILTPMLCFKKGGQDTKKKTRIPFYTQGCAFPWSGQWPGAS